MSSLQSWGLNRFSFFDVFFDLSFLAFAEFDDMNLSVSLMDKRKGKENAKAMYLLHLFDEIADVVTEFIEGLVETYPNLQYLDGFPEVIPTSVINFFWMLLS